MKTGRKAVDEFFAHLEKRLPQIPEEQRRIVEKVLPELMAAATSDPVYFERELLDAARTILNIGKG